MQCQHAQELFSDYVSGATDRALTVTIENHLTGCDQCRDELSGFKRVWTALDEFQVVDAPLTLHAAVMQRTNEIRAEEKAASAVSPVSGLRSLFKPRTLAVAASTALILLLSGAHVAKVADLDPIAPLIRMLHPAPVANLALAASSAEWSSAAQGGQLTIHLRGVASPSAAARVNYSILLSGRPIADKRGVLSADQESTIAVPLSAMPAADALSVSLSSQDGSQQRTVPINITAAAAPAQ